MGHKHFHPGGCGPIHCPPSVAPTQYDPGTVDPPQTAIKTTYFPHVVQHVHPTHTVNVNKHVITHQHYFPHTESCVSDCCEQHVFCGAPVNPCCPPMPPRPFGF